jgi:hypothetical protein
VDGVGETADADTAVGSAWTTGLVINGRIGSIRRVASVVATDSVAITSFPSDCFVSEARATPSFSLAWIVVGIGIGEGSLAEGFGAESCRELAKTNFDFGTIRSGLLDGTIFVAGAVMTDEGEADIETVGLANATGGVGWLFVSRAFCFASRSRGNTGLTRIPTARTGATFSISVGSRRLRMPSWASEKPGKAIAVDKRAIENRCFGVCWHNGKLGAFLSFMGHDPLSQVEILRTLMVLSAFEGAKVKGLFRLFWHTLGAKIGFIPTRCVSEGRTREEEWRHFASGSDQKG